MGLGVQVILFDPMSGNFVYTSSPPQTDGKGDDDNDDDGGLVTISGDGPRPMSSHASAWGRIPFSRRGGRG